ncbi:hypothetical protein BDR22DRAFT_900139 [Usnea florida]
MAPTISSLTTAKDRAKNAPRSKHLPWFQSNIGSSLTPAGRHLLEEYSGIPSAEVVSHIHKVRDIAWDIFPWPCIGQFWFVTLGLACHPSYSALLIRLRSPSPAIRLLDLGTCLGQDLRKLVADGVPPGRLFGTDLFAEYEAVGHELFRDRDRFQGRFIAADLFDDDDSALGGGSMKNNVGTWDVVNIFMFLHIWDLDTQVAACKRILNLLSPKPGSMVIGAQSGSTQPGEVLLKPPHVADGEEKRIYRHSLESFREMWGKVGKEEGVELKVEVVYDDPEGRDTLAKEEEKGERQFFFKQGPESRKLFFTIERP